MNAKMQKAVKVGKNVLGSATVRTTALQSVKKTKAIIAAAMSRKIAPGNKTIKKKIVEMLESPFGDAIVAAAISVFIIPLANYDNDGDPVNGWAKVATELQTTALTIAADKTIDMVTDPMMALLSGLISAGDAQKIVSGIRVAVEKIDAEEAKGHEHANEQRANGHSHAHS